MHFLTYPWVAWKLSGEGEIICLERTILNDKADPSFRRRRRLSKSEATLRFQFHQPVAVVQTLESRYIRFPALVVRASNLHPKETTRLPQMDTDRLRQPQSSPDRDDP